MPPKPRSYDPSEDSAVLIGVGSAHGVSESESPRGRLAGRILLPDPEQRRGVREWYVYQPAPEAPARRPLGFRPR